MYTWRGREHSGGKQDVNENRGEPPHLRETKGARCSHRSNKLVFAVAVSLSPVSKEALWTVLMPALFGLSFCWPYLSSISILDLKMESLFGPNQVIILTFANRSRPKAMEATTHRSVVNSSRLLAPITLAAIQTI